MTDAVTAHRFRFFVTGTLQPGARALLAPTDQSHVRVLRLAAGAAVEVVDEAGTVFDARLEEGGEQVLVDARRDVHLEPQPIELIAGALVGGRFDELVDGAVQAGASRITPLALRRADATRLDQRRERLQRIALAAAKQAKRTQVPEVAAAIDVATLLDGEPGIIVDAHAPSPLDAVVEQGQPVRLLVGPAEGLDAELIDSLLDRGWSAGRLGPTILRAELAAAVAVAIAAMRG